MVDMRLINQESSMKKMWMIIGILSICDILGLFFGGIYINSLMDKPLGPSLHGNSIKQTVSGSGHVQTSSQDQNQTPAPSQSQNQGIQLPPLCGNTPVLTVLAVGTDFEGDNYLYGLADVIRVVRIDFTIHQVSVLTLERDIWLEIPGISDHYGITHGKINQAYFFGVPAMGYYDGAGGGAGLLAATLKKNFDLDVDNYVVVDMAVFTKFVDALGGIDVNLPTPIEGSPGFPYSFKSGEQHLTGKRALELARSRENYSTIFRNNNQTIILKAIFAKLNSPEIIPKIPKLLQAFQKTELTDLSTRQIESMICLLKKMDKADLLFHSIPARYYVAGWTFDDYVRQNVWIWNIDFNVFRSYISDFMKGQWPQE